MLEVADLRLSCLITRRNCGLLTDDETTDGLCSLSVVEVVVDESILSMVMALGDVRLMSGLSMVVVDAKKTGVDISSLAPPSVLWESLELLEPSEESTADMTREVDSLPIGRRFHM